MKIWITGAQGLIGQALERLCKKQRLPFIPTGHAKVDISSQSSIKAFFHANSNMTHVINCAAYTRVDDAENQAEEAFKANTLGPENIGKLAHHEGLKLVHLSTDYVFDCENPSLLPETAPYQPSSVYAKTKQEGEVRLLAEFPHACIVRTSWVFGRGGKNFISSLWNRLHQEKTISVVHDQVNRLTYASDLAEALLALLCHEGIFHFANQGIASRYDVAVKMRELLQANGKILPCEEIVKTSASTFPTLAARPRFSILDTQKIERIIGISPRNWQDALKEFVDEQSS
ncbi:MAG: dTDP-4-dehydrorhamnose reductase [Rhabdochlamydiaceae bacterium]